MRSFCILRLLLILIMMYWTARSIGAFGAYVGCLYVLPPFSSKEILGYGHPSTMPISEPLPFYGDYDGSIGPRRLSRGGMMILQTLPLSAYVQDGRVEDY